MDINFGSSAFGIMFTVVPLFMGVVFLFIIGTIIYNAAHTAKNKTKPVIPARAKIVSKRTYVRGDHSYTTYYATFEFENGERIELTIPRDQAGYLIEGDNGILSFQGDLFVKFERM
ncbi:MAG: hypothetical protein K0S71_42 [Clostridia bacterium]|jgi:hypothetical protein|nr:hypothetical protein [Clostridia bacterium]